MAKSINWCFDKSDEDEWVFQQDNAPFHKSKSVYEISHRQKNYIKIIRSIHHNLLI